MTLVNRGDGLVRLLLLIRCVARRQARHSRLGRSTPRLHTAPWDASRHDRCPVGAWRVAWACRMAGVTEAVSGRAGPSAPIVRL